MTLLGFKTILLNIIFKIFIEMTITIFQKSLDSLNLQCPAELCRYASGTTTVLWSTHCHDAGTVSKFLNRNGFGEGNDTNQGRHVFLFHLNKNFKNYVLNLVNFSKFEGIPSWIWLLLLFTLFFDAWFILDGHWSSYF
jgi:hypothetical protein